MSPAKIDLKVWFFLGVVAVFAASLAGSSRTFTPFASAGVPNSKALPTRRPAGSGEQQSFVDEFTGKILALNHPNQVRPLAESIVNAAAERDPQRQLPAVQMFATLASLTLDLESITYRARGVAEGADLLYLPVLQTLRSIAYRDYAYGPHVRALFAYFTRPSVEVQVSFARVSDLQDYLMNRIIPKLEDYVLLSAQYEAREGDPFSFVFDRRLLAGAPAADVPNPLSYVRDDEARKAWIKPTYYWMNARLGWLTMSLLYFSTLELNDLPLVANRLLKKTRINNFKDDLRTGEQATALTPMLIYQTFHASPGFLLFRSNLRYRNDDASLQDLLDRAFVRGKRAAYDDLLAHVCGVKYHADPSVSFVNHKDCVSTQGVNASALLKDGAKFLIDPNQLMPTYVRRAVDLQQRYAAFSPAKDADPTNPFTVERTATGVPLSFNVRKIFSAGNAPRFLMPVREDSGYVDPQLPNVGLGKAKGWNYAHGKAIAYPRMDMGGILPNVASFGALTDTLLSLDRTPSLRPFVAFLQVPSTSSLWTLIHGE